MTVTTSKVDGMSAGIACRRWKALWPRFRGRDVKVDLAARAVTISGSPSDSAVEQTPAQAGYIAIPVEVVPALGGLAAGSQCRWRLLRLTQR